MTGRVILKQFILFNCDPGALLWPSVPLWIHWCETAQPAENTSWGPTSLFQARESQCPFYTHCNSGYVHWGRVRGGVDHCHKKVRTVIVGNYWRGLIVRQIIAIDDYIVCFYTRGSHLEMLGFPLTLTGYKWKQIHLLESISVHLYSLIYPVKAVGQGSIHFFPNLLSVNALGWDQVQRMPLQSKRVWRRRTPIADSGLPDSLRRWKRSFNSTHASLICHTWLVYSSMLCFRCTFWALTTGSQPGGQDPHILWKRQMYRLTPHNALQSEALWACRFVWKGWEPLA